MGDVLHLDNHILCAQRLPSVFEFGHRTTIRAGDSGDWAMECGLEVERVALMWNSVGPLPRRATVAQAATMLSVRASHQGRSRLTVNRPQLFSPSIVRGRIDHRHR